MYNKLNITENHLQILSLFTKGYNREYYIREVHKILGISPRTAQIILEDLEKKSVLESSLRGKIRTYKIRKNHKAKQYFILIEHYKKMIFLINNPIISEIIEKTAPLISGIGIIFGSFAKATQKKDSDLDLVIAGKCEQKKLEKTAETYGVKLSVKNYPEDLFRKGIRNDILVREVIDAHIVFFGIEEFVEVIFDEQI